MKCCVKHHQTCPAPAFWCGVLLVSTPAPILIRMTGALTSQNYISEISQPVLLSLKTCLRPHFCRIMCDHALHTMLKISSLLTILHCYPFPESWLARTLIFSHKRRDLWLPKRYPSLSVFQIYCPLNVVNKWLENTWPNMSHPWVHQMNFSYVEPA